MVIIELSDLAFPDLTAGRLFLIKNHCPEKMDRCIFAPIKILAHFAVAIGMPGNRHSYRDPSNSHVDSGPYR